MGGNRGALAGLLAVLLTLGTIPGVPGAQAASDGCSSPGCSFDRAIAGDFWAGELEILDDGTVEAGSTVEVTLDFHDRTGRTGLLVTIEDLDDNHVPLGIVVWIEAFRDEVRVYHEPIAGDPVDVTASPVGELEWDQIGATVRWNVDQFFDAGSHRLVVAGPTADTLQLDVDLASSAGFQLGAETDGASGGALVAERAWDPATLVDAPGLKLLQDGAYPLDVPEESRLYGYHGPATGGAGAFDTCFLVTGGVCGAVAGAPGTNYGHSVYGLERPDGSQAQREASWPVCTFATCPDGPAASGAFTPLAGQPGTWTFTVDEHRGVGTAPNLIAVLAPVELPS